MALKCDGCTSSRVFENIPQNGPDIRDIGDSQVSGHCSDKKHRGLAVLVGVVVKLSP